MTAHNVIALDVSVPRAVVPQSGDTYNFPRDATFAGDVGVGVTNPSGNLHVKDSSGAADFRLEGNADTDFSGIKWQNAAGSTPGMIIYSPNSDLMAFRTNNTDRLRCDNSNVTVMTGNLKINTSGKGIEFPSGDVIDDYEEGTHSATLTCITSGSYTLSANTLRYTKIGRMVNVIGTLTISGESSPSGRLRISLPFTASGFHQTDIRIVDHGGTITNPFAQTVQSAAYCELFQVNDSGALSSVTEANVDTAFTIYLNIVYWT